jgi:hypothetical protein
MGQHVLGCGVKPNFLAWRWYKTSFLIWAWTQGAQNMVSQKIVQRVLQSSTVYIPALFPTV